MPDIFSKEKRSWVMSRVRNKDTKPELFVERVLTGSGVAFSKHSALVGHPDFVIESEKVALFVDGDFWHGYRMGPSALSGMNEFWRTKISGNKARDRRVTARLRRQRWTVARIWEHDIERKPDEVVERIRGLLRSIPSA